MVSYQFKVMQQWQKKNSKFNYLITSMMINNSKSTLLLYLMREICVMIEKKWLFTYIID